MLNLQQIEKLSDKLKNKPALITDEGTVTWLDYKNLVANNCQELIQEEIMQSKVTRALVISENNLSLFILYSCLASFKVPYSGIDYTMSDDKQIAAIQQSKANLVFYSGTHLPSSQIKDFFADTVRFVPLKSIRLDLTSPSVNTTTISPHAKNDISSISFTSGTSGLPKCIYRTHSFDKQRLDILRKKYLFSERDLFLVTMPFYHVSVNGWIRLTLINGGTVVFGNPTDAHDLYYKIANYHVTAMLITPIVLKKLVSVLNRNSFKNKNLRFIMVGGKNFPTVLKFQALKTFGPVVNEYYGSSETGINTLASSDDFVKYPESSGTTMEGSSIEVLNQHNKTLEHNQIGRIAINSFQNAASYANDKIPEININGKRFIVTSDYGYKNEEGYIFITQRLLSDNIDIKNNLFRLENHFRMIRGIDDVAIFKEFSGIYTVTLSLSKSSTEMSKKVISEIVASFLRDAHIPKFDIKFIEAINYSLSGKVRYNELISEK